ncbi:MAG TPA: stage II sporulation protein M [Candidatus Cybelea sp.]|nr:stage II sporulation protein M [Candidatus Cybelea sp.]
MEQAILKSTQFRREREPSWRELEGLLEKLRKGSPRALTPQELTRLPTLYRGALSSLSVARSISLDQSLLAYLESLANRAYFQIYGPRAGLGSVAIAFIRRGFPGAVQRLGGPMLLAIAITIVAALAGYFLSMANPEWYYTIMPGGMAEGRLPTSSTEELRRHLYETDHPPGELLSVFASFLFVHNAGIGIVCFALGFAFGLPTALLLISNGLMLGAFIALYASHGLGSEIGAWLIIHGSTEILAVALCGGAGFALARALLFPGGKARLAALSETGRTAGQVALGCVLMFVVAGMLEGFARQLVVTVWARYAIGGLMLLFWTLYFLQPLPPVPDDGDR